MLHLRATDAIIKVHLKHGFKKRTPRQKSKEATIEGYKCSRNEQQTPPLLLVGDEGEGRIRVKKRRRSRLSPEFARIFSCRMAGWERTVRQYNTHTVERAEINTYLIHLGK